MNQVLTKDLVYRAALACSRSSKARKDAEQREEQKTIAIMRVFEPLLDIKSEQELKALSLTEVLKVAKRRIESGKVQLDKITPERLYACIKLSQARRNVAWKDVFLAQLGEARVQEVLSETAESFSYKIVLP